MSTGAEMPYIYNTTYFEEKDAFTSPCVTAPRTFDNPGDHCPFSVDPRFVNYVWQEHCARRTGHTLAQQTPRPPPAEAATPQRGSVTQFHTRGILA